MKLAKLLHNPSAGDEEHKKNELIELIESKGFKCNYSSTKAKGWAKFEDETDFLIVAGGDGTVRKVVKELIERKLGDKQFPIAVLPMGTANNVAATLGLSNTTESLIDSWHNNNRKSFDIGKIYGESTWFFMEGFGFGVFPRLMKEMKKRDTEEASPEKELEIALEVLIEIIDSYKAKSCTISIDGIDHSGNFLLVEVMNIRSIGPNLNLAPLADPGDGLFEVVLVTENQREELKKHIENKLNGIEVPFAFSTFPAKNVTIKWDGMLAHADDEFIEIDKQEVKIQLLEGVLSFMARP